MYTKVIPVRDKDYQFVSKEFLPFFISLSFYHHFLKKSNYLLFIAIQIFSIHIPYFNYKEKFIFLSIVLSVISLHQSLFSLSFNKVLHLTLKIFNLILNFHLLMNQGHFYTKMSLLPCFIKLLIICFRNLFPILLI